MEKITFHKDAENPRDLVLVSSVFIRKDIREKFEKEYNMHNLFVSNSKPYLYGFSIDNDLIRCDVTYE